MTGNIVIDFFLYLVVAGAGAGFGYAVWQLLLEKPKQLHPKQ